MTRHDPNNPNCRYSTDIRSSPDADFCTCIEPTMREWLVRLERGYVKVTADSENEARLQALTTLVESPDILQPAEIRKLGVRDCSHDWQGASSDRVICSRCGAVEYV